MNSDNQETGKYLLFRGGVLIYPEYGICIVNCVVEVILSDVLPLVDSLQDTTIKMLQCIL